jgi:hypothetical protein
LDALWLWENQNALRRKSLFQWMHQNTNASLSDAPSPMHDMPAMSYQLVGKVK